MPQRIIEGSADAVRRINHWSMRLLGLIARVRPDERRDAVGAFLTLFGFMVGHALLETARDALFLARLPATRLPWVYLAIAVVALVLGQREPRVVRQITARNELGRWLLVAGGVTLGLWLLLDPGRTWHLYALYVWSGVLASLVVVRFWTVLGGRFTVTQAKRIFPVIASGSVAGAILGSGAARILTAAIGPENLVLAGGLTFLLAAAAPALLGSDEGGRPLAPDPPRLLRQIVAAPYLRRVMALVLLATVTFTLIDFVFKSAADRLVPTESLDEFFSSVYLTINVVSLLVQVFGVGWLLRRVGVASSMVVLPALLVTSTLGFAVGGGLALALLLKGSDGALRHSLYRTATELLFVPLSNRIREVKGVIDVLGQRGGQAVASVLILMVLSTTSRESVFAALACLTAVAWLGVAVGIREHYLNLFRQTLLEETRARRHDFPALDHASAETLVSTLDAPDEGRVLAALDILQVQGEALLVPASLLFHPSPSVVCGTLDLFVAARREDAVGTVRRLLEHEVAEVRAAAVRALGVLAPERDALVRAAADRDAGVRVTADVMLLTAGWSEHEGPALERLLERADRGDVEERRAMAKALQASPTPALADATRALLASEETAVLVEAVRAVRAIGSPGLIEPLIPLLSRRSVRDEVRVALASFGAAALTRLGAALDDPALPHVVRRHVPGAIAMIGSPRAPALLLAHLRSEPDGMIRFKVLRALGRWRSRQPHLPLDLGLLQEALGFALSRGFRLMGWRRALADGAERDARLRTEVGEVLGALLADKQDHALERTFRLLNLQSGSDEFERIYRGLHSPLPTSRAGSRELLQHLTIPPFRKALLTLVDDLHGEDRVSGSAWEEQPIDRTGYERIVGELVESGMESVSSLAATHAVELGLRGVEPALTRCAPLSDEHAATLERCARTLRIGAAT